MMRLNMRGLRTAPSSPAAALSQYIESVILANVSLKVPQQQASHVFDAPQGCGPNIAPVRFAMCLDDRYLRTLMLAPPPKGSM